MRYTSHRYKAAVCRPTPTGRPPHTEGRPAMLLAQHFIRPGLLSCDRKLRPRPGGSGHENQQNDLWAVAVVQARKS